MSDQASVPVVMPQMGESLAEGTLVRWLKKPGDTVQRDEPLFEISTDKVDTDVPSSAAGVLGTILVREGQTVAIGTTVALITPATSTEKSGSAVSATNEPVADSGGGHFRADHAPQTIVRRGVRSDAPASSLPAGQAASFTPAVLETARQSGVSLARLTTLAGSGRGGRITKRDVERFLSLQRESEGVVAPDLGTHPGDGPPREYLYTPKSADRLEPMSPVRRKIAHHMTWSVRISPHATAFAECDMSGAVATLAERRGMLETSAGAPLTHTVLAAYCVVQALEEFPSLNASVVGDTLVIKPQVHLGVAVALEDTDDLVVPVVRSAGHLSIADLARAIGDLVTRARARMLAAEDVQGGTFTLTNPGVIGGLAGTPILNQPQVGILGLGAITKRAVVVNDAITIRPMMTMALTFDHRAADGMLAFRFLARVRELLEHLPLDLDSGSSARRDVP